MLRALRREPGFYQKLWALSAPIILQNIITTSLGFADTFMVGQCPMAAEVYFIFRRKPPQAVKAFLLYGKGGFGKLVFLGDILHCLGIQPFIRDTYSSSISLKDFICERIYNILFQIRSLQSFSLFIPGREVML